MQCLQKQTRKRDTLRKSNLRKRGARCRDSVTYMATPSSYWKRLLDLWSDPPAESFLQELSHRPIPKSGLMHKVLLKTEKLLDKARSAKSDAVQAERCGAVALLARILHRLQQHPCKEDHFGPPQAPLQTTWYSILQGLAYIAHSLRNPTTGPQPQHGGQRGSRGPGGQLSWVQQLQWEAGMCMLR